MRYFFFLLLLSCSSVSEEPEPSAPKEQADLHADLLKSVEACKKDEDCMTKLKAADELLGNCPWYEAIGCSAAVAAAGAACVVTEGEACLEALELVAKIGCCDCLPKGKVQDMCKEI